MSAFQRLDDYIKEVGGTDDFWSDVGSDLACEFVQAFTDEDWAAAVSTWPRRDPSWQVKFASVAATGESQQALSVLLDMVTSPDEDVMEAAAGALRELNTRGVAVALTPASLERLRLLAAQGSAVQRRFLGAFLQEMGGSA